MRKEKEEEESSRQKENEDAQLAEAIERFDFQPAFALKIDIEGRNDDEWWLDSGCSRHMKRRWEVLHCFLKLSQTVKVVLAEKSVIPAVGIGSIKMLFTDSEGKRIELKNVLHVPDLQKRLLFINDDKRSGNNFLKVFI